MSARSDRPLVMVVDDTAENLKLLDGILEGGRHEVRLFSSGAMMLKAAAKDVPDLVLLDILMPEMDGYEVCRRMRGEEALHDVPVLFLSALSDVNSKVKAFEAGGMDYVTKPFQVEEVKARVKTHLLLRKSMRDLEEHRRDLEQVVREKVREVFDSQLATITALSKLAESRDDESGHHVERTRAFCGILCGRLSRSPRHRDIMTEDFVANVCGASVLHDVGKVAIPDKILTKPGRLAPHEYEVVKNHAHIGARTLEAARRQDPRNAFLSVGVAIARSHHERWNGGGYPDRLRGEGIPLSARIMAVSDVYDALRSRRPYKPAMPHAEVAGMIRAGAGTDFDPAVVDAFLDAEGEFAETYEEYSRRTRPGSTTRREGFL